MRGPDEAEWVAIVDRELGNLRAAHQWLIRTAHVELALRLSLGLHYYMLFRFRDEVVSWGQEPSSFPARTSTRSSPRCVARSVKG